MRALIPAACVATLVLSPVSANAAVDNLSKERAQHLADAGVLRASGLKGFSQHKTPYNAAAAKDEARMAKCLGLPKPSWLAINDGSYYLDKSESIEFADAARVFRSTAAANKDITAWVTKGPSCWKTEFDYPYSSLKVTSKKTSVPGADSAFELHTVATVRDKYGTTHTFRAWSLGARIGQTEVLLFDVVYDGKDPGDKQVRKLVTKQVARVHAVPR